VSPTQRARAFCKANGWTSQIVERFNVYAKVRQDLFGVIDLVVLDGQGGGPLGVQVCAGASHAARRDKALAEPRLREWLSAPARFEVWSYSKRGERGKRKLWTLRREAIEQQPHSSSLASDGCTNPRG
jgi:hypothetical protein